MTVAMVLTTAISLALVGTGLLAVRTQSHRTEQLYSDRVESVQVALTADVSSADTDCSQAVCSGLEGDVAELPAGVLGALREPAAAYERYLQLFKGQSLAEVVACSRCPRRCG